MFTANTMHVAQANLMIQSLFDPEGGNFQGDLWVISTHLSKRCQAYLESKGIKFLINPLVEVQSWPYRERIAKAQPEYKSGELSLDEAFLLYRNKRMSKLIVCDWVDKFGHLYDNMALCDNDLFFQRDVNALFEKTATDPDVLWYWQEENENLPGTNLWIKNFHYGRLHDSSAVDFGAHEINIGFVIARPQIMRSVFLEVRQLFSDLSIELFENHLWHDQDLVRVIRGKYPDRFRLFEEGDVLHLCNGGQTLVEERAPQEFYHKKTDEKPCVVHFAGGVWKGFPSIAASYKVHDGTFFFVEERTPEYDVIRQLTDFDPFDGPSPFFTKHNIRTRDEARATWMPLRSKSKKKSLLFFSWLETGSHVPQRQLIADFLEADSFDVAVIDGNVNGRNHHGLLYEDLPNLLSKVTSTVQNVEFSRLFGYVREDVPEGAIEGAMAALCKEYNCSPRSARAVANAAYLYLRRTLSFYRPDMIVAWGAYLLCPRILKHICAELNIPFITMELGVLPETIAFDCQGHMGESWVCNSADDFNRLPLSDSDIRKGQTYLERARNTKTSRNIRVKPSANTESCIAELMESGKKTLLVIGSNSAFSGYVPYDAVARQHHSPFYPDNEMVVRKLSEAFGDDQDVQIIYKPHPITITRGLDVQLEYPNVTILPDANLDDCIDMADVALTLVSQGGYESLLRDTPVVMLGRNQINGSGAVTVLEDAGKLAETVRATLAESYSQERRVAFEEHVARLLKYYLYNTTNGEGARDQSNLASDMLDLLEGRGPQFMKEEEAALRANLRKTAAAPVSPKISVVMPVYNGEDYLVDCIGSILSQSFGDFELICVNNGSTDGSQGIIDYFAACDPRVVSVYQEEPNQRSARNLGISKARGTYLHLSDCDDLLVPDAYTQLVAAMEENEPDVLYFFFHEMYNTPKVGEPRYRSYRNYLPDEDFYWMQEAHKTYFSQYPFPWAKLFRLDFFREKELFFDLDCANFDDNPQNLRTLLSTDRIGVLNRSLYKFRINEKSMTQSVNPRVYGMLDAVRIMNEIYMDKGLYARFQAGYVVYKIHLLHFAFGRLPEDLREDFFKSIADLFLRGDTDYFWRDDLFSLFPYLDPDKVTFIEYALKGDLAGFEKSMIPADPKQEVSSQVDKPVGFHDDPDRKARMNVGVSALESKLVLRIAKTLKRHQGLYEASQKAYRRLRYDSGGR